MSKLEIINSILHDKFLDSTAILVEKDKDRAGNVFEMKRTIVSGKGISYSLYKYDSKENIFPFFKDKGGEEKGVTNLKKMCDYVFFIEEGKHLFVFLVELKKGTESAKKQLEAGECFVQYIISTIKRLNIDNFSLTENTLHFRKIRISESKSNKEQLNKGFKENESGVIEHFHPKDFHILHYLTY